jgi:hypothetical protein
VPQTPGEAHPAFQLAVVYEPEALGKVTAALAVVASYTNVAGETVVTLPAASVARTRSVYGPSAGKLEPAKAYLHELVPVAVTHDSAALPKLVPFQ